MKTKVHKVTLLVVDHDDLDAEGVEDAIVHTKYPNRCISPRVMDIETVEVDWSDDHPLNRSSTMLSAFDEMFDTPEED